MSDFVLGARLLVRGAGLLFGSRRLLLLGALPALVTTVLYLGLLAVVAVALPDVAAALTGFAEGWGPQLRAAVTVLAGFAVFVSAGAVAVVTFVAVTLAIGGPFYERLSDIVDERLGAPAGPARSTATAVLRGIRDGAVLIAMSVLIAIPLFVAGFLPVVGQTVVPVLAALVGGRLLVVELTGPALVRRGLTFAERRRLVRSRRALTWGFGVPAYLLCAVPLVAILAVPAAAAGATLLARELQGEPGADDGARPVGPAATVESAIMPRLRRRPSRRAD